MATPPGNPDALKGLILVSKAAIERLQRATDTKTLLTTVSQAQNTVIADFEESLGEPNDLPKKIAEADAEIGKLNQHLAQIQAALLQQLTTEPPTNQGPGFILKGILTTAQDALFAFSQIALSESKIEIPIAGVWNLERGLNKAIQTLSDEGMFLESEDQKAARIARRQAHAELLDHFLGPQNEDSSE